MIPFNTGQNVGWSSGPRKKNEAIRLGLLSAHSALRQLANSQVAKFDWGALRLQTQISV
jgi:hypothetical protein